MGRKTGRLGVIFLSGYSWQGVIQNATVSPDAVFLQKPLTPETVARQIRELLDTSMESAGQAPGAPRLTRA